jgi:threonine/homoserine/homoserine lactone efflux protein
MTEIIVTIIIVGLIAGFILSMPIAGPISILITSNALKGRMRYCRLVSLGASFGTVVYVFVSVFGLTKLFPLIKPALPYLFSVGALFLLFLGYKLVRTKIDLEHLEEHSNLAGRIKKMAKGGFYTGFMINFLNPTLLFGWFASTFFVISFVTSLGFNTGGLDKFIHQNAKEISRLEKSITEDTQDFHSNPNETISSIGNDNDNKKEDSDRLPTNFQLVISAFYSLFVALGSIAWFYLLTYLLVRYRQHVNVRLISLTVNILGFVLAGFGFYFGFMAVRLFIS